LENTVEKIRTGQIKQAIKGIKYYLVENIRSEIILKFGSDLNIEALNFEKYSAAIQISELGAPLTETILTIAADVTVEKERIKTLKIREWGINKPDFHNCLQYFNPCLSIKSCFIKRFPFQPNLV